MQAKEQNLIVLECEEGKSISLQKESLNSMFKNKGNINIFMYIENNFNEKIYLCSIKLKDFINYWND